MKPLKKNYKKIPAPLTVCCFLLIPLLVAGCSGLNTVSNRQKEQLIFDVYNYNAAGDGKILDTEAIQSAVNQCAESGGGIVYLHNGSFLSGTVRLKSNVTLYIEAGAELLGSTDINDYPPTIPGYRSFTDNYVEQSLIYAEGKQNITIKGAGTIDGQGASFKKTTWKQKGRPYIIRFIECKNVKVKDITLKNSPMWMQHYLACDNVFIINITVWNHGNLNNDMMDIDSCRNVIISGCLGDSDDDALTLKSTSPRPCESITITNCILRSNRAAFKMGTESNGGFKDIAVSNCVLEPSRGPETIYGDGHDGREGISLLLVDGGKMENVNISNVVIKDLAVPVFMRLGDRARPFKPDMPEPGAGSFRNVRISNLTATGASKYGCAVSGIPSQPVENVTLSDIKIAFAGGGTEKQARAEVPEKEADYPQSYMFGVLPAYGFYIRHARNIKLGKVTLSFGKTEKRPALFCDDVTGLAISALDARTDSSAQMIKLRQVRNAFIKNCRLQKNAKAFLGVQGNKSADITVMNNDITPALAVLDKGAEVKDNAVYLDSNRTR